MLHGALMAAVSLFPIGTAAEVHSRLAAVRAQLSTFAWLKNQDQPKLEAEKKALQERLEGHESVSGEPLGWSVLLRTVAASVPESTTIKGLSGEAEVEATLQGGRDESGRNNSSFNFATPMADDGVRFRPSRRLPRRLAPRPCDPKRHFPSAWVSGAQASSFQAR